MTAEQLPTLSQAQRDRLAFIEMRLRFFGEIRRQDLVERFDIQSAAATRDLALYKDLASRNIDYDAKAKCYVLGDGFEPVFDFPPERVLAWLTQGFGDGEPSALKCTVVSEIPSRLTHPDLDVLASVTRAIHLCRPLRIEYQWPHHTRDRTVRLDRHWAALARPRVRPEDARVSGLRDHSHQEARCAHGAVDRGARGL
jgi:hypothetical protein